MKYLVECADEFEVLQDTWQPIGQPCYSLEVAVEEIASALREDLTEGAEFNHVEDGQSLHYRIRLVS